MLAAPSDAILVEHHVLVGTDNPWQRKARLLHDPTAFEKLKQKPLQQVWRDHLLAGSLLLDAASGYEDGFFAFLHPAENDRCARAVDGYRACRTSETSFVAWTIEAVVAAVRDAGAGAWIDEVAWRYFGSGR